MNKNYEWVEDTVEEKAEKERLHYQTNLTIPIDIEEYVYSEDSEIVIRGFAGYLKDPTKEELAKLRSELEADIAANPVVMEIDIKVLYTKYDGNDETGGRDSWEVIADIINEVAPRTDFTTDAAYFHRVKELWNMCQEYINSTYAERN